MWLLKGDALTAVDVQRDFLLGGSLAVTNGDGTTFADELELPEDVVVISKATRKKPDAYSGFDGNDPEALAAMRDAGRRARLPGS